VDERKETPPQEVKPRASMVSPGWSAAKKVIRIVVGVILILLGLAALLTPLTPGSWLVPIGLELLGLRVLLRDWARAWAAAKPDSRIRKVISRALGWDGLDAMKRKWRRRGSEPRS
jgi:protein-S-isoprenylcysteine O-methyltransferase Ste14